MSRFVRCAGLVALVVLAGSRPAVAAERPLLLGGDVSLLPLCEDAGVTYTVAGKPGEALAILGGSGCNTFRVRLFVAPDPDGAACQDLAWVARLGARIKARHATFLLDLHYSDTWADPGRQETPRAWSGLAPDALAARVESYTAAVVDSLTAAGARPDIVQLGNEITPGLLWPAGRLDGSEAAWVRLAALLRAAGRGARRADADGGTPLLLVHLATGGDPAATRWFLAGLARHDVPYDLVGLSYYPWWHGAPDDLAATLDVVATEFGRDVLVVETAQPWREGPEPAASPFPATPAGQAAFLCEVVRRVRETPGGHGRGVLWWAPEGIAAPGVPAWRAGDCALFDAAGEVLPALDAFRAPD
ncbi:glycosyl hydrolase 53 family protein [bacterium]|nr:glycosyl hydrolase 53 family protein [bacterium]